ncbi:unnamed protein product [Schistosoma turkestanicum]|nr:unnamed protein product [Schistosoma turkestanicum]
MIVDASPFVQTLLGTGLTWFVTAIGSVFCFIVSGFSMNIKHQILDGSLGFSSGWFEPASVASNDSFHYSVPKPSSDIDNSLKQRNCLINDCLESNIRHRSENSLQAYSSSSSLETNNKEPKIPKVVITRRLWLLIIAITVHNIPEGLAVGIAFGGLGKYSRVTFSQACNLAIGIAIQNFPEGLAVSLPLYSADYGFLTSFWYGQLSGLVEPLAGLVGCLAVHFFRQLQPYALGFAAGAMLFVVVDEIIPESQSRGHGRLSSIMALIGFATMMCLEVVTETA